MNPTSLTLARGGSRSYQVTFWQDGVARWDSTDTERVGAWQALVPRHWFRRAAPLALVLRSSTGPPRGETTIVVEGDDARLTYCAGDGHEPDSFWILATVLDGMAATTPWSPLDSTGLADFSGWASAVRMTLTQRSCWASALARPEGLVVLTGSRPATSTAPTLEENYMDQRSQLEFDGGFELRADRFVLTRHLFFSSPSAAASVMAGSNTNGRRVWQDVAGRFWADLGLEG
jgi:Domain of unknown function (DUF4357)